MNGFDRSVGIALKRKYQRTVLRTAGAELLIRLKAHIADIHHIIPVLPQQILGVGDKHGGDLIPYDQGPAAAADHFRRTPDQSLVDQLEPPRKAPEGILHIGNGMGGIPAQHAMDLIQRSVIVENDLFELLPQFQIPTASQTSREPGHGSGADARSGGQCGNIHFRHGSGMGQNIPRKLLVRRRHLIGFPLNCPQNMFHGRSLTT